MVNPDYLIIGGGIVGLTLALEAKRRRRDADVLLIEKEGRCGAHASGRNSGVLHAGFYYTADSLKARFTRDGNAELSAYCDERGLKIRRCGKLVVTRGPHELAGLDTLFERGRANGVELEDVTADEAREIEPRIRTFEKALWSPNTSSVDPNEVVGSLVKDLTLAGVRVETGVRYLGRLGHHVTTSTGTISPGYVINAAGLYADKVARDFDCSQNHRILPFKGFYLYGDPHHERLNTNVYPVPDLANPFLGVHFTHTVDGRVKIGPTATPALWREHYDGFADFKLGEFVDIVARETSLIMRNTFGFRRLAVSELRKLSRRHLVNLAAELVTGVTSHTYRQWGQPGIRAQLYDTKKRKLEMDFRFEGDDRSFHILNAVSPAFTCALPFSRYLFDEIDRLTGQLPASSFQPPTTA